MNNKRPSYMKGEKLKYVYVLTSDENDYFWEQCYLSITSLKYWNHKAEVILLVDNQTALTLVNLRKKIHDIAEVIIINFDESVSKKTRSRLLKMEMRNTIEGEFLYIDSDTIIAGELDEINQSNCHIGMVLDKHEIVDFNFNQRVFELNAKKMGYDSSFDRKHFNGGMMYVDESEQAYEFFDLWKLLYLECVKRGLFLDQTSLNEANSKLNGIITELDGKWNVQLDSGLKYLHEGKILHYAGYQPQNEQRMYFNTLSFKLCDAELFKKLKEDGSVSDEILNIIKNPKSAFKTSYIVPYDCVAYQLIFSNHFRILKFLYVKMNRIYNFFEEIYKWFFVKIYKRA